MHFSSLLLVFVFRLQNWTVLHTLFCSDVLMSCLVVGCVGIHSILMHHYILFVISSCCGIYGQNYAAVCIHVLRGQFLSLHSQRVHSCAGKCSVLFLRCTERFRWPYFSVIFVTMMPPICWAAWGIFSDQPVCLSVCVYLSVCTGALSDRLTSDLHFCVW